MFKCSSVRAQKRDFKGNHGGTESIKCEGVNAGRIMFVETASTYPEQMSAGGGRLRKKSRELGV